LVRLGACYFGDEMVSSAAKAAQPADR
jgi:hypothetical protein